MSLASGSRLGAYEIVAPLGAGGMGEVLRARDPKLGREVAIKVLPAAFAQEAERVARFRREAQILASLHHPNIASIFGLEESEGTLALVMELVEGEDLGQRLRRGALPVDEVVAIARQIAEALEEAHERGIVHRDLKPANVKVTADGRVKVLDFGLAKALAADPMSHSGGHDLSQSPTLAGAGTMAGVILGTAAYMSPEQARGKAVDKRSDIWAFGVLLYEMLTGRRLFEGESVSDVVANVLKGELNLAALPGSVPARLRSLVERCLQRDPKLRLRDIGEARLELARVEAGGPEAAATDGGQRAFGRRSPWFALAATAALASLATLGLARWSPRAATSGNVVRLSVALPEGDELGGLNLRPVGISPDGSRLAWVGGRDGTQRIFVRLLSDPAPTALDGTEGGESPFFSPDGQWLAFFSGAKLRKIALGGGSPQALADASYQRGGAWGDDGFIYYAATNISGLWRVPEAAVPRGPVGGGIRRPGPDRHEGNGLVAQRFDAAAMALAGESFPVVQDVADFDFAGSAGGGLSYIAGARRLSRLAWFDRDGKPGEIAGDLGEYQEVALSRGGRWLGFSRADPDDGDVDVWLQALAGGAPSRLTSDPDVDHLFAFSHDEREVAWEGHAKGALNLMRRPADASSPARLVRLWGRAGGPSDWSPHGFRRRAEPVAGPMGAPPRTERLRPQTPDDGRFILYHSGEDGGDSHLWAVPAEGPGEAVRLTEPEFGGSQGQFSPDGRHLAFTADVTGSREVYVQRVEGLKLVGGPVRVSESGGHWPQWRRDGAELYFINRGSMLAAAFLGKDDRLVAQPRRLFTIAGADPDPSGFRPFAATPDGRRFVAIVSAADATPHPATVILDWRTNLGARP